MNSSTNTTTNDTLDEESSSSAKQVKSQLDDVLTIMHNNVKKASERGENINELHEKTNYLSKLGLSFKRKSHDVRKRKWWSDIRGKILIVLLILILIAIIVIPLVSVHFYLFLLNFCFIFDRFLLPSFLLFSLSFFFWC